MAPLYPLVYRPVKSLNGRRLSSSSRPRTLLDNLPPPHLQSTILGSFVANLYEAMDWSVVRVNYLGDWGKNLGLLGVDGQRYGSEETLNSQKDRFKYMHGLYTKIEE
jgi:arginyl-tRNA synthetase